MWIFISVKTSGKNGQHDRMEFFQGGKHTHEYYDSNTGRMGGHGENASKEDKKWMGEKANASSRGNWTKDVK